jgi:hypothetical protein
MIAGARIVLDARMDAARGGLAGLAEACWIMSLPKRNAAYGGHPAGRGRPGRSADGRGRLVAVTFGSIATPAVNRVTLPFRWEPVASGVDVIGALNGSITLAPAVARRYSALTLAGNCQIPPGALTADGREQARLELMEASREFITSVGCGVARAAGAGPGPRQPCSAWAW